MEQKVVKTIEQYAMLQKGDTVAVGVSGGKDSVALLHILCALRETYQLHLVAVHIHHGIRGEEADADERFVERLCRDLAVEYRCFHFDVPALAKQRGLSEEACGREVRYKAFGSINADKIATAHTLSDSVETMLFHFTRGSGSKGLCGIPPVRGNIIRPLIACKSDEILTYLKQKDIAYREDSTNSSDAYTRNFIRLSLIPLFKQLNPSFEKNAAQTISVLREQSEYFREAAKTYIRQNGYRVEPLKSLPIAMQHETVRFIIEKETGITPEYKHLIAICENLKEGAKRQINAGIYVRVRHGQFEFPPSAAICEYCFPLKEGSFELPIGTLTARILNCKQFENLRQERFSFAVDYDTINSNLVCRNKHEGDRFYDSRRGVSKSMKKYLNEIGFMPEMRSAFPVFCAGENMIGTLGSVPAKKYTPGQHTKKVLYLYLEEQ
ncbi:MAG: tRNA lysidine(34) synthetase TilS [Clostridia bacterium]|nr:tRNA lysidine(34) synthetase TilS [Clostridia bacterium]